MGGDRDRSREVLRTDGMCYPAFNGNNFATIAALAEVCALLSAVLIPPQFGPCDPDVPDVFQDCTYPTGDCGCLCAQPQLMRALRRYILMESLAACPCRTLLAAVLTSVARSHCARIYWQRSTSICQQRCQDVVDSKRHCASTNE